MDTLPKPLPTALGITLNAIDKLDALFSELTQASSPHFNPEAPDGKSYPPDYRANEERTNAITSIRVASMWLKADLEAIREEDEQEG
jgi:hypothetical protein